MIKVENIVYEYPGKVALKGVSFELKKGSIAALVGPNGAGKTTLLRCIAALEEPFSGKIKVDGIDTTEEPRKVHQKIGYLSDFFGIYNDLTVKQSLSFIASIHNIAKDEIEDRIEKTAKNVDIHKYLDVVSGTLSRGLRQRLGIAQAIIHNPKIILLDEPASGLDPEARIKLSEILNNLKKQGITLIISSHILSELEDYCDEMLLLRDGKIISQTINDAKEDKDKAKPNIVNITLLEDGAKYAKVISEFSNVSQLKCKGNIIECIFTGDKSDISNFINKIIENKIPLNEFSTNKKKLQDIYMDYANGDNKDDS